MERNILHCDLNNFYASVETLFHPEFKGKPLAVAGRKEERKGIVLAKNELAKACGVKTGDEIWKAELKCPGITVLPPDFSKYSKYSKLARGIYERYTEYVEPFGPDECWLDVTGNDATAVDIAESIRRDIKQELGITVSVGVSFNKIFAKLGSDLKKPDGVTVITKENYKEKVWPLPVEDLLFVGRATKKKLNDSGIYTIGALAAAGENFLYHKFGKNGRLLSRYARGEDFSAVSRTDFKRSPKSIGNSRTFPKDLYDVREVEDALLMACEYVGKRLREQKLYAGGVGIWLKDTNLVSHQFESLTEVTCSSKAIFEAARTLFEKNGRDLLPLRALGVRLYALSGETVSRQLTFDDMLSKSESQRKREEVADAIRRRFGYDAVKLGAIMYKDIFDTETADVAGLIPR